MKKRMVNVAVFLLMVFMVSGCSRSTLKVKKEEVTVEYGNTVSLKAKDYLDNDKKLLSKVKVSSDIKNENKKEYPGIGEYAITFAYKKQEVAVKVSVVDTVKPEFVDFKESVEVYQNSKVDFNGLYTAEDLSSVTITSDDSKVDYAVAGSYVATVTATDASGNAETKEVTANVLPVTVTLDTVSSAITVGGTVQLNATVNVPDEKATYTSSDSAVATVDENGLVSGVKAGTATVTAELNGVKAECEITVKAVKATASNRTSGGAKTASATNHTASNNSSSTTANNSNSQTTATVTPQTSREAFDLINAERMKLGLEPAVWDAECERIALIRAKEIAQSAEVTHDGFLKFQNENHKLCECLAWGYMSASGAVNGWMNSPAHKEILMSEKWVYLAVVQIGTKWVAVNSR